MHALIVLRNDMESILYCKNT